MRLDTSARRAVAAALLAVAAASLAAPPAHAQSTELVFEVADGLLGLSSVTADATDQTSVAKMSDGSMVIAQLGTVTINDTRFVKTNWSYSATVADIQPVKSKSDRSARPGAAPSRSNAQFNVKQAPTADDPAATFDHVATPTKVDGNGTVSNLVRKTAGSPSKTTFPLELQVWLPENTAPGAYHAAVTHTVS